MLEQKTTLKFYNTLTNRVDDFKAIDEAHKTVTMYSCGPTVYSYAHIGNFRAYVFMDVLRRVLKYNGYKINGVMNITDVGHLTDDNDSGEDKMELTAKKENKSPYEVAKFYAEQFFIDAKKLNIGMPEHIAYATGHVEDMIAFVKGILDNGYAYEVNGNVYFDVEKYNEKFSNKYGELSGLNLKDQMAGARIEVNAEKKSPYDFALWIKAPKEHIMKWDSPWGLGYPGWHIECSAMGKKYLGNRFDIHTGGVDHIPVHHENEIAQSRGLTCDADHTQANFWMHCEFLKVDNGKMSKSLGNVYTINDLETNGYSALDYRYFLLNANFKKSQNFTWEALDAAKNARHNLIELLFEHKHAGVVGNDIDVSRFLKAINGDLNIPLALSFVWELLNSSQKQINKYTAVIQMDKILGLSLEEEVEKLEAEQNKEQIIPAEVKKLAEERWQAKAQKNWVLADELRKKLTDMGYNIKDAKDTYEIEVIK
ncbi:MAG: cysteine--tRNA ligase [Spirochaetales bacterium]